MANMFPQSTLQTTCKYHGMIYIVFDWSKVQRPKRLGQNKIEIMNPNAASHPAREHMCLQHVFDCVCKCLQHISVCNMSLQYDLATLVFNMCLRYASSNVSTARQHVSACLCNIPAEIVWKTFLELHSPWARPRGIFFDSTLAKICKTPTHNILLEDIVRQHSLAEYSLRALQQDTLLQPPFVVYAEHYCNSEH